MNFLVIIIIIIIINLPTKYIQVVKKKNLQ